MVAGSVPRRSARARTLRRTNSRGRSKVERMMACRFGLSRLRRADGLFTGTGRVAFRRRFIGQRSMLESGVLVNRMDDDEPRAVTCFAMSPTTNLNVASTSLATKTESKLRKNKLLGPWRGRDC